MIKYFIRSPITANIFSSTAKFKYAGQNIARRGNSLEYENTDKAIERMVLDWFNEYPDANMSYIDAFRLHDEG